MSLPSCNVIVFIVIIECYDDKKVLISTRIGNVYNSLSELVESMMNHFTLSRGILPDNIRIGYKTRTMAKSTFYPPILLHNESLDPVVYVDEKILNQISKLNENKVQERNTVTSREQRIRTYHTIFGDQ